MLNSSSFLPLERHALSSSRTHEAFQLHKLCFKEPWSQEAFASLLALPSVQGYFAQVAGEQEPIGLILGNILFEEAEIYTLATVPSSQRKGVATYLLENFLELCLARLVNRVLLEVSEANVSGQAFYKKMGFLPYGRREKYYASSFLSSSDALLLEINLNKN